MAENAHADEDKRFSTLVEGVVTKAQAETKCVEADMLRDVIKVHINTWLSQVEEIKPLYKVSELIPVGSYAEGTKIIQPDEFDYLAVIEEFSKPDMIEIDADNSNIEHGLVKVVVINKDLKLESSRLCKNGHLQCFQPINFPAFEEARFGHVLIKTLQKVVKSSKKLRQYSFGTPTDVDCLIALPTINNVSLLFKGAKFQAPNVILRFQYKNKEVSVDISPAIRYYNIQNCFREKDCAGPSFAELVLKRSSLLFVGTLYESDFKVTVTEAEVEYIHKVMKLKHKTIYIFLKYVVNLFNELGGLSFPFSSYMMKTICIHHDIKCEKKGNSMKECYRSILKDLIACKPQKCVQSIVNKNILLAPVFSSYEWDKECLLPGLEKICQLPINITSVETFESFLKKIVRDQHQERSDADEEKRRQQTEFEDSFRAKLDEKISKLVDMGFDIKDVREVTSIYGYDINKVAYILRQKAKTREEENIKQKESSSKLT